MALLLLIAFLVMAAPAEAAGTQIATSPIGRAPGWVGPPSTVLMGDRFITAWFYSPGFSGPHIYGVLHDGQGRRISPAAFPIVSGTSSAPTISNLVAVGDRAALFWQDGDVIRLTWLDREGRTIRTIPAELPRATRIRAVWNGTHFGIGLDVPGLLETTNQLHEIDVDGRAVAPPVVVGTRGAIFDVIAAHDSLVVLYRRARSVEIVRVHSGRAAIVHRINAAAVAAALRPDGSIRLLWATWPAGTEPTPVSTAVLTPDDQVRAVTALGITGTNLSVLSDDTESARILVWRSMPQSQTQIDVIALNEAGHVESVTTSLGDFSSPRHAVAGDTTLLVSADNGGAISAAVLHGDHLTSREIISLTPANQGVPQLVPLNGSYLAVWSELRGAAATVRRTILDGAGNRRGPVSDSPGVVLTAASNGVSAVILTITGQDAEIVATQVDGNGELLNVVSIPTGGPTTQAAVVWAGSHYVVAWAMFDLQQAQSRMFTSIVTTAGTASAPRAVQVSNLEEGRISYGWPLLAFNGKDILLAWSTSRIQNWPMIGPYASKAVAVLLDPFGSAMQSAPTMIVGDEWASRLSLAGGESEFVLITSDWRAGGRIRGTTIVPTSAGLRVESSRELFHAVRDVSASVEWDGAQYVVVLNHAALDTKLVVKYLDSSLQETKRARMIATPASSGSGVAQPSFVPVWGGALLIGFSEIRGGHHTEAVTYRDLDMDPLPDRPSPPSSASAAFGQSLDRIVTWTEPSGGAEVEGYVVEFRTEQWTYVQVFGRDVRSAQMSYLGPGTDYVVRSFNAAGASDPTPAPMPVRRRAGGR
jgi:hypothetical protein